MCVCVCTSPNRPGGGGIHITNTPGGVTVHDLVVCEGGGTCYST